MSKSTYTLTFRGDTVAHFTSVHPEGVVVMEYRRLPGLRGKHYSSKMTRAGFFKTVEYAKKVVATQAYPGQMFAVKVAAGTTEITEAEVVA